MNELIKISDYNGKKAVSARELHLFLEIETRFDTWVLRMIDYGFIEGVDCSKLSVENQQIDWALTVDCAKHWSMMQRTEKGMQARQYFIDREKELQAQLPSTYLDALKALVISEEAKQLAESQVKELAPKAKVFDQISSAENLLSLNDTAKVLGKGRNKLMEYLRSVLILRANNTPYQEFITAGYFEVKVKPFKKGDSNFDYPQTYVTGKGLIWLKKRLSVISDSEEF